MIPRYSRPEMTTIWEPATRFRIWFEIEAHAADAMAKLGTLVLAPGAAHVVPDEERAAIETAAKASERAKVRVATYEAALGAYDAKAFRDGAIGVGLVALGVLLFLALLASLVTTKGA